MEQFFIENLQGDDAFFDAVRNTQAGGSVKAVVKDRPVDLEIVNAYGGVLAEPSVLGVVQDLRSLPYSKKDIKTALLVSLGVSTDDDVNELLKVGYLSLAQFQPLSEEEVRALQLWNGAYARGKTALARRMTRDELDDVMKTAAEEGDVVNAVMKRIADETDALAREPVLALRYPALTGPSRNHSPHPSTFPPRLRRHSAVPQAFPRRQAPFPRWMQ